MSVLLRFSAVCYQVIHNLNLACKENSIDDSLLSAVAEGWAPATGISRPILYGTGGFTLSPGVFENVLQSLAPLRNA
ncbi:MAG: hypothetical protein E7J78_10805, partial [Pantoea sp.]|nr:hypothetical protein [Pantoea sp.]